MPLNAGKAGDLCWWVMLRTGEGRHTVENQRVIAKCSSRAIAGLVAALHEFGAFAECDVVHRDLFAKKPEAEDLA
jgi:hypothetical protein